MHNGLSGGNRPEEQVVVVKVNIPHTIPVFWARKGPFVFLERGESYPLPRPTPYNLIECCVALGEQLSSPLFPSLSGTDPPLLCNLSVTVMSQTVIS